MSGFSVFNRMAAPAPAPQTGGNWGLALDVAGKAQAPNNRPLFTNFQATPAFQNGRVVDVEPLPFDHLEKPSDKEKKFRGGTNPVEHEAGIKEMTPPAHIAIKLKNRAYDNLALAAYNQHGPGALVPSPELLQAQLTAIETARRQSLDIELTREINGEIVDNFRQWLLKKGSREDHVRAGWWPTVTVRGRQVPDPKVPKFIEAGGALSDHPSVRAYLDSFVVARVNYERDLVMMRLEASHGAMQDWSIDKLWKYYKFGVLGLKPDAEVDEIMDNVVPAPIGTASVHSAALPAPGPAATSMSVDSAGQFAGQLNEETAATLMSLNNQAQDTAALQAEQVELQRQQLEAHQEALRQAAHQAETMKRMAEAAEQAGKMAMEQMKVFQREQELQNQKRKEELDLYGAAAVAAREAELDRIFRQRYGLPSSAPMSAAPVAPSPAPMSAAQESPDLSIKTSDLGKVLPPAPAESVPASPDISAQPVAQSGSIGRHGDTPKVSMDEEAERLATQIERANDLEKQVAIDALARVLEAKRAATTIVQKALRPTETSVAPSPPAPRELSVASSAALEEEARRKRHAGAGPKPDEDVAPLASPAASTAGTSSTIDYSRVDLGDSRSTTSEGMVRTDTGIAAHGKGKEPAEGDDPSRPPMKGEGWMSTAVLVDRWIDQNFSSAQERSLAKEDTTVRTYIAGFAGNPRVGPDKIRAEQLILAAARERGWIQ